MSDEPRFTAYHLALAGEEAQIAFEDDLDGLTVVEALRALSQRFLDLADFYEVDGTASLFESEEDDDDDDSELTTDENLDAPGEDEDES